MAKNSFAIGMPVNLSMLLPICEHCITAKQTKTPVSKTRGGKNGWRETREGSFGYHWSGRCWYTIWGEIHAELCGRLLWHGVDLPSQEEIRCFYFFSAVEGPCQK